MAGSVEAGPPVLDNPLGNASDGQSQRDLLAPTCDAATALIVLRNRDQNLLKNKGGQFPSKIVIKMDIHCDKQKQKVIKSVSGFPGVDSVTVHEKTRQMQVVGDIDPVDLVVRLRKITPVQIARVELISEEPEKDEGPEKEKQEGKKRAPDPALESGKTSKIWKAYLADKALLTAFYNVQSMETIQMLVLVFVGALKKIGERKLSHIDDGFEPSAIRAWERKHWRN